MNIDYLKNIENVNLDSLPRIIRDEFERQRFGFTIELDGTYYSNSVFDNLEADIFFVYNGIKLNKHKDFNNNLSLSKEEYPVGFSEGFYDRDFLNEYPELENKIFQIFSGVYKKTDSIGNPDILRFKKNASAYNSLNFLQKKMFDYGYEVGCYIRDWTIILNNPNLFEKIFNEKLETETVDSTEGSHQEDINSTDENNLHPTFNPNLWNRDCFELFKYLYDCYYINTKRQLTNIWFYLHEIQNGKYILKATKDEYMAFILEKYQIKITNFDKAGSKWENIESKIIDEHRINFEDTLKSIAKNSKNT